MGTHFGSGDQTLAVGNRAFADSGVRGVFAQVMGLVAVTMGCRRAGRLHRARSAAARDRVLYRRVRLRLRLNIARQRQRAVGDRAPVRLGLLLGLAVAPVLAEYAHADPSALWQAAGATGVSSPRSARSATPRRRDLSSWRPGPCSGRCWR